MAEAVVIDDYYSLLQVPQSATISTIREAYKKRALRFHPDKNKDANATSDFQRLSKAWETLKDATRRAEYDRNYVKVVKRKFEDVDEEATRAWRRRRDEMEGEASAHWAQHAQSSDRTEQQESLNTARRSQKALAWKAKTREEYMVRLGLWTNFRDKHVAKIRACLRELLEQRMNIERFAKDDEAIAKARTSGAEITGFVEALEKMMQARKLFAVKMAQDAQERKVRLHSLMAELKVDRRRYELEEAGARREQIREAVEMLGPRNLNPPLFSMIDRRGQGINHWKALYRVKLSARFPSSLEAYAEGPWHVEGNWERLVGEHKCGRCDQLAFHIVSYCSPAKCPGCGLIVCNDCYRDFQLLREYGDWLVNEDEEVTKSLFSLVYDLCRKPFRATWENDPGCGLGFDVSHM